MSYCGLVDGDAALSAGITQVVDAFYADLKQWHAASKHWQTIGYGFMKGSWATLLFVFPHANAEVTRTIRREKRTDRELPQGWSMTVSGTQVACWVADTSNGWVRGSKFPPFTFGRYPGRRTLRSLLRHAVHEAG